MVPGVQVSPPKNDSLIEHISIGLPNAVVQVQILHVHRELWFNGLQRRRKLNIRSGPSHGQNMQRQLISARCFTLPQVRASRALIQPQFPPDPLRKLHQSIRKRSRGLAKLQFQENRSSSEKGEIKDLLLLQILGKKIPQPPPCGITRQSTNCSKSWCFLGVWGALKEVSLPVKVLATHPRERCTGARGWHHRRPCFQSWEAEEGAGLGCKNKDGTMISDNTNSRSLQTSFP